MNENIIKGRWKQMTGYIQKKWGKLTDNDLDQIKGEQKNLTGTVQKQYGTAQKDTEKQLNKLKE
ncbi:MAG: CsbD family protein [Micavibrio sp.]|nr:MAG: CsbD family protein [Micavibrio sp.]